ncbi:MAG TPA: 4Fe-4S dicluster domain-containing protein, partial [Cyclobacteriaceae bacterium]|nr:4Fe-4S dicluster domain-containing protein [Cyclobacteriaceae bacterium]
FATTREITANKKEMSRLYTFESNLSLTGANADYRSAIKPSQEGLVVAQLYKLISGSGSTGIDGIKYLEKAAAELKANAGKALVVSGSNDKNVQVVINAINNLLGSYGTTINTSAPVNFRQGNDEEMAAFVAEATSGKVDGVIFYNCNPVYDHPQGAELGNALKNITLTVSTSITPDETASASAYIAADHHYLESWNDAEPKLNSFSLSQPAITPIFRTRQAQESFLVWAGESNTDYFSFVQQYWKNRFFAATSGVDFQSFWDKCLYDGVYELPASSQTYSFNGNADNALSAIASTYNASNTGFELVIYESCAIGSGSQANNPLLQELPDPITKATWDHYVTISLKDAEALGIENDAEGRTQLVTITANGKSVSVAALVQPGQAPGTLGVALGYGRTNVGLVGKGIGANVYPLLTAGESLGYSITSGVKIEKTETAFQIAQTQIHQTYMGRANVVQESILSDYLSNPNEWNDKAPKITSWDKKVPPGSLSMWKGHEYKNHHWGMAIDLNTCTGCGSCVVACNVENNVALVGKEEVINRREMHWLRIDRYYSSEADVEDYQGLEKASDNPEVVFQPMLCQHCNNAPCETVCPVAATTHSTEGLNQMTYNRCIGTRYCANNCPYKVRRFNWFKYHDNQKFLQANPAMNTDLGRMVLNPDVTVRSRGVMEKCSFCAQRIQAGKLNAKKERRPVQDGEVVTACQAACSTGAIVFGDMNDPESKISKLLEIDHYMEVEKDGKVEKVFNHTIDKKIGNPRAYRVLEEIGVKPNIFYLTKIRNKDKDSKNA